MQSPAWFRRRREVMKVRGSVCEACGSGEQIHVHHDPNTRLGHELDSDLRVLCDRCHQMVHAAAELVNVTLDRVTDSVIERVQTHGFDNAWVVMSHGVSIEGAIRQVMAKRDEQPKWRPYSKKAKRRANRGLVVRQMTDDERWC
jgi:hypothetical protein